ncbi:MAG: hypothetical protein P9L97_06600 [Candidatus Tenebribacter davisii]|nr:hypothetical protein [Candidatus Tenebribacter davisii]
MAISYKITDRSYNFIKKYAWINSNLKLGNIGSIDSREIIRLLENSHYPNIEKCLYLINEYGFQSDEIGESILKETDMITFQRALSELYLFKYLYDKLGNKVKAIRREDNKKTPDISVKLNEIEFLIEIYSPTDFYAYQIFSKLIYQALKNLNIEMGFDITTKLESKNFGYATEFWDYKVVLDWIDSYRTDIIAWLKTADDGEFFESQTPAISAKLSTTLNRINCDIGDRSISYEEPTRSNDTRHFYETSDPELFSKSQWGVKLKGKLMKPQKWTPSFPDIN